MSLADFERDLRADGATQLVGEHVHGLGDAVEVDLDTRRLGRAVVGDEEVVRILRAVRRALPAHGTLVIAEPLSGTSAGARMADAYFGLYLLAMGSGRARSVAALSQLLRAAGFARPQLLPTHLPAQLCLIVAKAASS